MSPGELLAGKREAILAIASRNGAERVRLFGSAARGAVTTASDVDFLVHMRPGRTLFDLVHLCDDLEQLLGCRVDVVVEGGESPHMKERIHAEAVPL